MYDALSQRKLHMSLHLHIKLNPGCALTALSISTADIQSLISNTAAYNFALRRGVTVTDSSTNQSNTDAQSAMRIVQKAASNAFGTDDERMKMRKRIDAFCDRFGKPHIHATITPIDADSGWIAINTSKFSSDDTLCKKEIKCFWYNTVREQPAKSYHYYIKVYLDIKIFLL